MGPPSTISETILRAVALHCSMCQVLGMGEAKPWELKGILSAAVYETKHKAAFELESVYRKAISSQAETMQNSKRQQNKDIRSQWTMYEKISTWLQDLGQVLKDIGFAEEKEFVNEDRDTEYLFILEDCHRRCISWDETDHPLTNEVDAGGPRSSSYTNPDLPGPGGSSTRGNRHITGVYGTTGAYEVIPPLFIFDSKAK
eukprot:CAMPEP_0194335564 /NCGR_PEP_ID=MMETSP0171-20130528/70038_1 /TAXON_ID=218684 /ORGANISM="Corethron pennatum, Strain L29A3" /LENGTH=199 /DNA_ID=CAMNT_0039098711 /DNA_START=1061 /DNA_END=1660 /DNA_ORIENTATION=+